MGQLDTPPIIIVGFNEVVDRTEAATVFPNQAMRVIKATDQDEIVYRNSSGALTYFPSQARLTASGGDFIGVSVPNITATNLNSALDEINQNAGGGTYVTTNSTQTGLTGGKTWEGAHTFNNVVNSGAAMQIRPDGSIYWDNSTALLYESGDDIFITTPNGLFEIGNGLKVDGVSNFGAPSTFNAPVNVVSAPLTVSGGAPLILLDNSSIDMTGTTSTLLRFNDGTTDVGIFGHQSNNQLEMLSYNGKGIKIESNNKLFLGGVNGTEINVGTFTHNTQTYFNAPTTHNAPSNFENLGEGIALKNTYITWKNASGTVNEGRITSSGTDFDVTAMNGRKLNLSSTDSITADKPILGQTPILGNDLATKDYVDSSSGGGQVDSIIGGTGIDVDTDPINPTVSVASNVALLDADNQNFTGNEVVFNNNLVVDGTIETEHIDVVDTFNGWSVGLIARKDIDNNFSSGQTITGDLDVTTFVRSDGRFRSNQTDWVKIQNNSGVGVRFSANSGTFFPEDNDGNPTIADLGSTTNKFRTLRLTNDAEVGGNVTGNNFVGNNTFAGFSVNTGLGLTLDSGASVLRPSGSGQNIDLGLTGNSNYYFRDLNLKGAALVTGQITSGTNGTAGAPSIKWSGDGNTGLYHANRKIGFSTGGVERFEIEDAGVTVAGDITLSDASPQIFRANDGGDLRLSSTTSNNIGANQIMYSNGNGFLRSGTNNTVIWDASGIAINGDIEYERDSQTFAAMGMSDNFSIISDLNTALTVGHYLTGSDPSNRPGGWSGRMTLEVSGGAIYFTQKVVNCNNTDADFGVEKTRGYVNGSWSVWSTTSGGGGGSTILKTVYDVLSDGDWITNTAKTLTVTVTGAAVDDGVCINPNPSLATKLVSGSGALAVYGRVVSANTVEVTVRSSVYITVATGDEIIVSVLQP